MFGKKSKSQKKDVRGLAVELKAMANEIVQDFSYPVTYDELKTLMAVISYMDTFLLRCLKGNKVTNKIWIGTSLIAAMKVLVRSQKPLIKDIVNKIVELEYLIRSNNNDK